jgi:hypothetical protein
MGFKKTAKGLIVRSGTKIHLQDIRLANNAGMSFPLCRANDRLLDVDICVELTGKFEEVTCENCKKRAPKRYPWASFGKKA